MAEFEKKLVLAVSRVYGNFLYYPVNKTAKELRKVFAYQKNQKTFNKKQVEFLKQIFEVEVIPYEGEK